MAEQAQAWRDALDGLQLPAQAGLAAVSDAGRFARLALRAPASAAARLGEALGLALPERINVAQVAQDRAALKLGPDEWLILREGEATADGLVSALQHAATGQPVSLVGISDRNCGLVLAGPGAEEALAAACPLPLDLVRWPLQRATRTVLGTAEMVLWRRAADRFHIEVARSFAPYVVALLAEILDQETALRRAAGAARRT
jgi:sarcosine oxidase subunit gamma